MTTQALYRKWRSRTFDEVIGQTHITQTLKNALVTDRIGHAYLFTGPRGTGKTSTARLLAKAVNCLSSTDRPCGECTICQAIAEGRLMDLIEIDAASNTSVDDIRDLRDKIDFRPSEAKVKFYIIDEVHMLSKSAFNALLKTLEEPPPHVIFVLATTEPDRIPATIISRCQRFDFRRISATDVAARLRVIVDKEGFLVDDEALLYVARQGGGSMRDAISLLDQLTAYGHDSITIEHVRSVLGAVDVDLMAQFVNALFERDITIALGLVNQAISEGIDPKQFALELLEYMRGLLLIKYGQTPQMLDLPESYLNSMFEQTNQVDGALLLKMTERFNEVVKSFRLLGSDSNLPQLPLELAVIELADEMSERDLIKPLQVSRQKLFDSASEKVSASPDEATIPTPPVSQTTPETELTLESVNQAWREVLNGVKRENMMAQALLNSGQLAAVSANEIVISLPSVLLKERAEKTIAIVEKVLQQTFGYSVGVSFIVDSSGGGVTTSPGEVRKPADRLVETALELGGKIDPESAEVD